MQVDGRKLSSKEVESIRFETIKRIQSGETPTEVARAKGLYTCRVFEWLSLYRAGGWDNLKVSKGAGGGRRKKLSGKQIQWVYETITLKSPQQLKFDFALWTRKMIQEVIRSRFNVKLSLPSIGRLLSQLGLSWQKPLQRAYEHNPALTDKWLKQTFPYIKARAKKLGAQIYFSDESGLRSDFNSGKTWAKKGCTPTVSKTGKRFSLNLISAISNRGDIRFKIIDGRFNAGLFIEFCRQLISDSKSPVFLIVDGHPAHKAKKVKEFIREMNGEISLYFLPPYSPDLNPDEFVWNDVKNNGVYNKPIRTKEDLKSAALSRLRHLQKTPEKVKSFFRAKKTRYAA